MGEAKVTNIRAVESRAALSIAEERRARIKDKWGRGVREGDGIYTPMTQPTEVLWRVVRVSPATEPQFQGAYWLDITAQTRMLAQAGPNDMITLVLPAVEPRGDAPPQEPDGNTPPGPGVSPGGIILPNPDGN